MFNFLDRSQEKLIDTLAAVIELIVAHQRRLEALEDRIGELETPDYERIIEGLSRRGRVEIIAEHLDYRRLVKELAAECLGTQKAEASVSEPGEPTDVW